MRFSKIVLVFSLFVSTCKNGNNYSMEILRTEALEKIENCNYLIQCTLDQESKCQIHFYSPINFSEIIPEKSRFNTPSYSFYNSEFGKLDLLFFAIKEHDISKFSSIENIKSKIEHLGHKEIRKLKVYYWTNHPNISYGYSYNCLNSNNELLCMNSIYLPDYKFGFGYKLNFNHKIYNLDQNDLVSFNLAACLFNTFRIDNFNTD